jgi:hypothetical protein
MLDVVEHVVERVAHHAPSMFPSGLVLLRRRDDLAIVLQSATGVRPIGWSEDARPFIRPRQTKSPF